MPIKPKKRWVQVFSHWETKPAGMTFKSVPVYRWVFTNEY